MPIARSARTCACAAHDLDRRLVRSWSSDSEWDELADHIGEG